MLGDRVDRVATNLDLARIENLDLLIEWHGNERLVYRDAVAVEEILDFDFAGDGKRRGREKFAALQGFKHWRGRAGGFNDGRDGAAELSNNVRQGLDHRTS